MKNKCISDIKSGKYAEMFEKLYPIGNENQPDRYIGLVEGYCNFFGDPVSEMRLFSSPGRTEIGGNHTDHQRGRVLAASVQMDTAAIVVKSDDNKIRISSEGHGNFEIDLGDLSIRNEEINTTNAVIRGVCARLAQLGYKIGGFSAYSNSTVPVGSGLSSSAAFENLVTTILSELYNNGEVEPVLTAQIGQYAENVYFGKPSGLMDQAASAVGGLIAIDFKDTANPEVEFISLNLKDYGYSLCVVNTGGDHADLTDDYSDIFNENKEVAGFFGKDVLREVNKQDFYDNIPTLKKEFGERAVLRAMHFFDDNQRVMDQFKALNDKNFELFKEMVIASGESSFNRLQNVFSPKHPKTQPISLALELSRELLVPVGGAWRVHGGGFAGTIQAYVPDYFLEKYKTKMDSIFGENATQVLAIRPVGSCEIR